MSDELFEKAQDAVRAVAQQHSQELNKLKEEGKFPIDYDFGKIVYKRDGMVFWEPQSDDLPHYIKSAFLKALKGESQ